MNVTQVQAKRFAGLFHSDAPDHYVAKLDEAVFDPKSGKLKPPYDKQAGPATLKDFLAHMRGTLGLVLVPVDQSGHCSFGAIDIDQYPLDLQALGKKINALRMPLIIVRSKSRGAHLYYFGPPQMSASALRELLAKWAKLLGFAGSEIFPKQDRLKPGDSGNGINLPYYGDATNVAIRADVDLPLDQFLDLAEKQKARAADDEELERAAQLLAPLWTSHRHDLALMVAGALLGNGVPRARVEALVGRVVELTGDEELNDRLKCVAEAARAIAADKRMYGIPKLVERLGRDTTEQVMTAFDIDDGAEPWSAPVNFLNEIAAPAFDADDVPQTIGDYAVKWAAAAGFDPTGVIGACVIAAGAALSDSIQIEVQASTNWRESGRLWAALIGPPGFAKTPMIRTAVEPLQGIHKELVTQYADTLAEWEASQDPKDGGGERREDKPRRLALYSNDCTIGKLTELLADNPQGILYLTEELDAWLGSHDVYRSGGGSRDRGEWLQLFDGGQHQVDRITRGSFFVPNWGVSMLSATTPAALRRLVGKLPNDGLLQRILTFQVKPPTPPDVSVKVCESAERYKRVTVKLRKYAAALDHVKVSDEARPVFDAELNRYLELAPACAAIGDGLAGHVAKYRGLLARLTLIFHAVECAAAESDQHPSSHAVQIDTVERAKHFLRKCFLHARAFYEMLAGGDTALQLARGVGQALVADKRDIIDRRTLVQKLQAFRDADLDRQQEAMQLLVDFGWCRVEKGTYQKSHSTRWSVNPAVHVQFAEYGQVLLRRRAVVKEAILAAHSERGNGTDGGEVAPRGDGR